MNIPMKKVMRNKRGALSKKVNEAAMNALPVAKKRRVPSIPTASPIATLKVPETIFLRPLRIPLSHFTLYAASNAKIGISIVGATLASVFLRLGLTS